MDMETKFGITPVQTQQLYEFMYSQKNVMSSIILALTYSQKFLFIFLLTKIIWGLSKLVLRHWLVIFIDYLKNEKIK